ncbi:MBOAT family O-acyltransferase [Clostridium sp. AL.422]|uniref:MBOAT family O-acyltransferase n=1 Tax=Clostridium TaxID=1485 RepID=UPI00293DDD46|nr:MULTISPECIES: MBOAT family O-acyltransferase [unclassified Clostridium]MDV4150379.1 MBOAT family O-acyltransferase [Clostridium sp. AL.422]
MVFSSSIFIFLFLPLVIFIYYISSKKLKNYILLFASLFFYAWGGLDYLKILIISITINYTLGILIDSLKQRGKLKSICLAVGIILNLSILFYYKYYDFFVNNVNSVFNTDFDLKYIALPIGISFFTFQGISYIIDIYRNDGKVNKNIFSVALYISFFPQLVAGPIIKYKTIDKEIRSRKESIESFSYGIDRFVVGLAKKVILADILGGVVNDIIPYHVYGIDTPTAWLGAICYTFQIYFDFSGYSDMAIGLGYMFGFSFMENFNYPYISKSITEFWRRWHISLSTWFREYLYIPLGGNRRGNVYFNLFIVFVVTGLWHGAAWNFVVWGLWHGLFIIIERAIRNKEFYKRIPAYVKWGVTILIVLIGWVLFRASSLPEAIEYIKIMFGIVRHDNISFSIRYFLNRKLIFWIVLSIIASTPMTTIIINKYRENKYFEIIKCISILMLFVISIIFVVNSTYSPFIYFQF